MTSQLFYKTLNKSKLLAVGSLFLFLLLLIIDIVFNKEMLYGDAGYYLLQIINDQKFAIEHQRPISIVIEFLPLILTYFHTSIDLIIISFALNQWLYYFICFLIVAFVFNDIRSAAGIIFSLIFGSQLNYFNPVSELILSTPLFFIFLHLLKKTNSFAYILNFFLSLLIIYNHPLNTLFLIFLIAFDHIFNKKSFSKKNAIFYIYILLSSTVHYFLLDSYEKNPQIELNVNQYTPLEGLMHFDFIDLISRTLISYSGTALLLFITCYLFIKEKKIPLLVMLLCFVFSYTFLVLFKFSFLYPNEPFERYMYPIPLLLCISFFHFSTSDFSNAKKNLHKIIISLIFLAAFYQYYKLIDHGLFVKSRYEQLDRAIQYAQQFNEPKIAFRKENYYVCPKGHDWIMSSESLLLSSEFGSQLTRQILIIGAVSPEKISSLPKSYFFYAPWWSKSIQELNKNYFSMTENEFRYANTDSIQSGYTEFFFNNINVNIGGSSNYKTNREYLIPITVYNKNTIPLTSGRGKEAVYLSYHWLRGNEVIQWEGMRSPIMADVFSNLNQEIIVKMPEQKGIYSLHAAIVYEGKRWCEINSTKQIIIE